MKIHQRSLIDRFLVNHIKLGLVIIVILAGLVRLIHLGTWSFWTDEIPTLYNAQHILENFLADFRSVLLIYPTTSFLIHIPVAIFGPGEWSARLFPAIIGIVSAPILYIQLRNIINPTVGIIAAFLLAISPWHLFWSQNARFYVVLFLFYNLALLTVFQGFEKNKPHYIIFSMIFLGFAISERLISLFFVPVIGLYVIGVVLLPFERPSGLNLRNLALLLVPGFIMGMFFAGRFILVPSDWLDTFSTRNTGPAQILVDFIRHVDIGVIGMGLLGSYILLRKRSRIGFLLFLNATVPVILIMAASLVQFAKDRYAFISLASWIILAAYAAYTLYQQTNQEMKVLIFGTLFILLVLSPVKEIYKYHALTNGDRDDLKTAFQFVVDRRKPQDLILSDRSLVGFYYLRETIYSLGDVDGDAAPSTWLWWEQPTWFIVGGSGIFDKNVYDWIQTNAELKYADGEKLRVYYYKPPD
ncbi:MAG: glycosyltransferase family 39 protein [Anaerolineales bacterium]|nr:glycosyltransferase family 39 protein [Anaerolineales bacterium]